MHLAVIGNGVAGVTAALRVRERHPDWRITLISGESTYHWSRPALMYVFMGHMRYEDTKPFEDSFWGEKRLSLVRAWVTGIDTSAKTLQLHRGAPITWDKLLIATGSKPNKFGWPGQDLRGVQGLWGLNDLKQLIDNVAACRRAVIVGGGLIGIELAEMLHSRGIHVTFLVRESSYWSGILPDGESAMLNRVIRAEGIDLRLETELESIEDDGSGRVGAVTTKAGERIECQVVGLTAGVSPNLDVVKTSSIETGRGVLVDRSFRTSVPDVYAAGDCAEIRGDEGERNAIQQVWYTGKQQGVVAGDVIAGLDRTYVTGLWFNSAKFLDVEYQTYGLVNREVEGERNLYWEHPDGRRAVRIVHTPEGVIGFNVMGLRWRHEVCESWLRASVSVEHVLERLEDANFDPELYGRHEDAVRAAFRVELSATEVAAS